MMSYDILSYPTRRTIRYLLTCPQSAGSLVQKCTPFRRLGLGLAGSGLWLGLEPVLGLALKV